MPFLCQEISGLFNVNNAENRYEKLSCPKIGKNGIINMTHRCRVLLAILRMEREKL